MVPGLYCIGNPQSNSPVLISCNYKLTVDILRSDLTGCDVWLLIVDTHGVNVWCAAGKKTFSTAEVIRLVTQSKLKKIAPEATLILPQLSATGVNAREVAKYMSFPTCFGPVYSKDLPRFLAESRHADQMMRRVTFRMAQRAVLIPVEIVLLWKSILIGLLAAFILSGLGPSIFSLNAALDRGLYACFAGISGIISGTTVVPLLLPWLPGRAFSIKGAVTGCITGLVPAIASGSFLGGCGLWLFTMATSSYLAMNFTGSTPFTSPSGVEKEMKQTLPWIGFFGLIAIILWICAGL